MKIVEFILKRGEKWFIVLPAQCRMRRIVFDSFFSG